jgi:hypothetical protein
VSGIAYDLYLMLRGTRAAQPAAASSKKGALYCVTDESNIVERNSGVAWEAFSPEGDVVGPASAVDDRIATFDGTTGKLLQDGGATIAGVLSTAATAAAALDAAIKLDDLATPDDNTDLNASTTRHGLLRKLDNTAAHFLDGQGAWTTPDHGSLGGLSDDDHSIYAKLAGRAGGQTLKGGTGAADGLVLQSTAHATRGFVETGDRFVVTRAVTDQNAINATLALGAEATQSVVKAQAYSPAIELLDKDATQSWHFGLDDNDSKAAVIGQGYGPGQGLAPAIKIDVATETITTKNGLRVGNGGSTAATIVTTTADGSDTNSLALCGGGGNTQARGARVILFGNEEGSLPGVLALQTGNVTGGAIWLMRNDAAIALSVDGATGVVELPLGQLKFPATQNPSSNVNTLDDYERGTWTSTIGGSGGQSGQVYASQTGSYVKKGRDVSCWGRVTLSTLGTITGSVEIQGLPFTSNSVVHGLGVCNFFNNMTTGITSLNATVSPSATVATLWATAGVTTVVLAMGQANLSNTLDMIWGFSYEAAS